MDPLPSGSDFNRAPHLPEKTTSRFRHLILGRPRDVRDPQIRHKISLVAFFAWVGLGADGLSSSAYGPEEAYRTLGGHTYLALLLALAAAATVFIISFAYSRIIEHFPQGGGGYLVATQLLGRSAGIISGCALLVDYVLTITVSIAGGGDAVFSLLPMRFHLYKLPIEFGAIALLMLMNMRGIKETVGALVPIFLIFIGTHALLILGGILIHVPDLPQTLRVVGKGLHHGAAQLGGWGLFLLFLRAYSLGGGTYTGIEAVSNGIGIMREPRVNTGKRTMLYMATSLALTAGGLLLCYMLVNVRPQEGQTLNTVLANAFAGNFRMGGLPIGIGFVFITIFSEAVLLLVAAQTGFIDGPRVMANMAVDSWLPHRFSSLSDRLTTQDGVLLMGFAAMATLGYTHGHIGILVVMYSINVFLTFSLSETGMVRFWIRHRKSEPRWKRNISIHGVGLVLCVSILCVMLIEKISEGGWITLAATSALIGLCIWIRSHYRKIRGALQQVDETFRHLPERLGTNRSVATIDPSAPTAVLLVSGYGGLGMHMLMSTKRLFPQSFGNVVFASVGVIDSTFFQKEDHLQSLEQQTREMLQRYIDVAHKMGTPAEYVFRLGTDVVEAASEMCVEVSRRYPRALFIAGTLAFEKTDWYYRLLHNETAYAIQRRLKSVGLPVVILPLLLGRRELTAPCG